MPGLPSQLTPEAIKALKSRQNRLHKEGVVDVLSGKRVKKAKGRALNKMKK